MITLKIKKISFLRKDFLGNKTNIKRMKTLSTTCLICGVHLICELSGDCPAEARKRAEEHLAYKAKDHCRIFNRKTGKFFYKLPLHLNLYEPIHKTIQ